MWWTSIRDISNTTLLWKVDGQQKKNDLEWNDRKKKEKNWDESEHVMTRDTLCVVILSSSALKKAATTNNDLLS